jgi:hypothetical protein
MPRIIRLCAFQNGISARKNCWYSAGKTPVDRHVHTLVCRNPTFAWVPLCWVLRSLCRMLCESWFEICSCYQRIRLVSKRGTAYSLSNGSGVPPICRSRCSCEYNVTKPHSGDRRAAVVASLGIPRGSSIVRVSLGTGTGMCASQLRCSWRRTHRIWIVIDRPRELKSQQVYRRLSRIAIALCCKIRVWITATVAKSPV